MTLFEYISVASSIILALALSRVLNGLRSTFLPDRRYLPHATWLVAKLINVIIYWWWLWGYHEVESYWNIFSFILILSIISVFYLQVDSLVGNHPSEVYDWRERFYRERRWFFGLNASAAVMVFTIFSGVLHDEGSNIVGLIWMVIALVYSALGFFSKNPNLQAVIAGIELLAGVAFLATIFNAPTLGY